MPTPDSIKPPVPLEAAVDAMLAIDGDFEYTRSDASAMLAAALTALFPDLTATRDQHGIQMWRRLPDGGRRVPVTHAELAELVAGLIQEEDPR